MPLISFYNPENIRKPLVYTYAHTDYAIGWYIKLLYFLFILSKWLYANGTIKIENHDEKVFVEMIVTISSQPNWDRIIKSQRTKIWKYSNKFSWEHNIVLNIFKVDILMQACQWDCSIAFVQTAIDRAGNINFSENRAGEVFFLNTQRRLVLSFLCLL